ncbi:MAG: hypothetical protein KAV87_27085 [Desulfobacteraceae bacterium]|nr:hypothetical protein [Desulfobacteraceae bacterium]
MSQKQSKQARKHLKDNHNAWVEARWRRPMRWLPGLKSGWFGIMLFPKLQWLFQFRMLHALTVDEKKPEVITQGEDDSHMRMDCPATSQPCKYYGYELGGITDTTLRYCCHTGNLDNYRDFDITKESCPLLKGKTNEH